MVLSLDLDDGKPAGTRFIRLERLVGFLDSPFHNRASFQRNEWLPVFDPALAGSKPVN